MNDKIFYDRHLFIQWLNIAMLNWIYWIYSKSVEIWNILIEENDLQQRFSIKKKSESSVAKLFLEALFNILNSIYFNYLPDQAWKL